MTKLAPEQQVPPGRRIYPLDPRELSEEQIAVAFAMTSRSTDPFDVMAERVSEARAAEFHERVVLNYGHASVAEHAVIHMAIENVSRLACDEIEDNRLASYTELSSRYLVIERNNFHVPEELEGHGLRGEYVETCRALFDAYEAVSDALQEYLPGIVKQGARESDRAYANRLQRRAIDNARFLLPAATLTNVGLTINARGMEHAASKLLSSDLAESRQIGEELKVQAKAVTPTLIKYADRNEYIALTRAGLREGDRPSRRGTIRRLVRHRPHAKWTRGQGCACGPGGGTQAGGGIAVPVLVEAVCGRLERRRSAGCRRAKGIG